VQIFNMKLLESFTLGKLTLRNRMVMAPMTRNRAEIDGEPNDLMAEYYRQRSTFGLIITEGTAPAHVGKAYPGIPGIYTESQSQGWVKIIDGVHDAGGIIFIQLMHSGRISHKAITGLTPLAPSAVLPAGEIFTGSSNEPFQKPAEMNAGDIEEAIESFCRSARLAIDSGADGVEIHAANGYLLHQFLSSNANLRSDQYGGKPENKARFAIEVVKRVTDAIGAERTGIRISPNGLFNDISETEIEQTYKILLDELDSLELAYLHVADQPGFDSIGFARNHFHGVLIANSGYHDKSKIETAIRLIDEEKADLFSFGRLALANPDLPRRIQENLELNRADSKTFYSRGPIGYTDYPPLQF
jgi:N-ethylmaleimide reductase